MTFELGKASASPGNTEHVFFSHDLGGVFLYTMADGATAETGLVGNDGMVGVTLILGAETTPNR